MNDIYDKQGWCGLQWLWTTTAEDSLNRPCAAHDNSIRQSLYSQSRLEELFHERAEIYQGESLNQRAISEIYQILVSAYHAIAKWRE